MLSHIVTSLPDRRALAVDVRHRAAVAVEAIASGFPLTATRSGKIWRPSFFE